MSSAKVNSDISFRVQEFWYGTACGSKRVFDTDASTRLLPQAVPYRFRPGRKLVLSTEFDYNNREARMSTPSSPAKRAPRTRIERIALGSDRAAKIMAVGASLARGGEIDAGWGDARVGGGEGVSDGRARALTDWGVV